MISHFISCDLEDEDSSTLQTAKGRINITATFDYFLGANFY
jgi:hypothetical protein